MTVLSPHNLRLWLHLVRDLLVDAGPPARAVLRRVNAVLPLLLAIGIPAAIVLAAWALPATEVRDFLLTAVELGALGVLVTALVLVMVWLSRTETRIRLTAFEVSDAVTEHGLDGRIIADRLGVALQHIRRVHQRYAGENLDGRRATGTAPSPVERVGLDPREKARRRRERDVLAAPSSALNPELPDVGTVAVGGARLSLSNLLITLKRLWPLGDSGPLLTGSLTAVGKGIYLVVRVERRRGARSIPGEFRTGEAVEPELYRIACQIQYELVRERLSAESPEAFQHFTDALSGFEEYQRLGGEVARAEDSGDSDEAERLADAAVDMLEAAEENAFRAIDAQPDEEATGGTKRYREAQSLLVQIAAEYYVHDQRERCEQLFRALRDLDPTRPEPWTGLGQLYLDRGQPERALALISVAARLDRNSWSRYADLGDAYQAVDQPDLAELNYQKAVECAPTVPGPWLVLGDHHQRHGRYAKAGYHYRRARMAGRTEPDAWLRLGDLYLRRFQTARARHCYQRVADRDPGNAEAWRGLGRVATEHRDLAQGRPYFLLAARVGHGWAAPYADLGDLYDRLRRYDDAVVEYRKCLARIDAQDDADHDLYVDVLTSIARCHLSQAQLPEAEEQIAAALCRDPGSPTAWLAEGDRRRLHHDDPGARRAYRLAAEAGPAEWSAPLTRQAVVAAEAGDRGQALSLCRQALRYDDTDDWTWSTLGSIHWMFGEYPDAVAAHRRAAGLNPRAATHWINQGVNLGEQGRYRAAESTFRRAAKVDPDDADVYAWWGDLALRSGDVGRAAQSYRRFTAELPRHSFEEQVRLAAIARVRGDQPAERAATEAAWAAREDAWRLRLATDADLLEFTALLHLLAADRDAALGALRGARAKLVGPAGFLSVRLGVYDLLAAAPMPEFFDEYLAHLPPVRVPYAQRAATWLMPVPQRPSHVGPPIAGRDPGDWSTRDEPAAAGR